MKVHVPPIKSQGIKTKLVPWIKSIVPQEFNGKWIEPFMGTGVVGFNIAPKRALLCDTNPHLVNFYQAIADKKITSKIAKQYLNKEGAKLLEKGESHYYELRARFNEEHRPLDFLFLNRACFNGMIRFNKKGGFNVPFCRKPERFAKAYITKIVNQIAHVSHLFEIKDFEFKCQSFDKTIDRANSDDIIYCDPPYIGRHVEYFNGWDEERENHLFNCLSQSKNKFILSTWHHNDFRKNEYIELLWNQFNLLTREHFYHIGGSEKNRNPMIEAIITNYETVIIEEQKRAEQLILL
ncbi:MAG: Dam family site-specific DNA-(adenine-N6)-methyltransferase [Gammaproteobacteria bacterium]|nr:Dam family site-specific DNA-(adenine-N6)-methyltransferase [Gammaproteobacteria bacterium]